MKSVAPCTCHDGTVVPTPLSGASRWQSHSRAAKGFLLKKSAATLAHRGAPPVRGIVRGFAL
eukprot:4651225-Prymnesium_polylepis.1